MLFPIFKRNKEHVRAYRLTFASLMLLPLVEDIALGDGGEPRWG
jgi:hypothetical protein